MFDASARGWRSEYLGVADAKREGEARRAMRERKRAILFLSSVLSSKSVCGESAQGNEA